MTLPFITAIRRNHALEHATIHVLLHRLGYGTRLMGRSTARGFYIYGPTPARTVEDASREALWRLQHGQPDLAISSECGTNLVVAGAMAGLSSALAMGGRPRPGRLGNVILAATVALILAQPIGRLFQQHLTTTSNLSGLRIRRVVPAGLGMWTGHFIETAAFKETPFQSRQQSGPHRQSFPPPSAMGSSAVEGVPNH